MSSSPGTFGSSDHDPIIVGIDGAFPEGGGGDDGDDGASECEHPGRGPGHDKGLGLTRGTDEVRSGNGG